MRGLDGAAVFVSLEVGWPVCEHEASLVREFSNSLDGVTGCMRRAGYDYAGVLVEQPGGNLFVGDEADGDATEVEGFVQPRSCAHICLVPDRGRV